MPLGAFPLRWEKKEIERMDVRKGFPSFLRRGFLLLLALGLAVGFGAFSSIVSTHAATFAEAWPLIGQGSTGEDVFSVQLLLQAQGFSLSIDGMDGPQTTGDVVSFQSAKGLQADGVVGPQTWPVLIVTTSNGSSRAAVEALQRQLNAHGASLTVDSKFGSATEAAWRTIKAATS